MGKGDGWKLAVGLGVVIAAYYWWKDQQGKDAPNVSLTTLKAEGVAAASPNTQFPFEVVQAPRMDNQVDALKEGGTANQPWYHDAIQLTLDTAAENSPDNVIPPELESLMSQSWI